MDRRPLAFFLALALLVAAGLFFALGGDGRPSRIDGLDTNAVAATERDAEVASDDLATTTDDPARVATDAVTDTEPVVDPAATASTEAVVRGRLVDHAGAPVTDARIRLGGWPANASVAKDENWSALELEAEPDGSFEARFEPPTDYRFSLSTDRIGGPHVGQDLPAIAPGAVVDVGTIVFPATGSLAGRIVRSDGTPVLAPWQVRVDSPWKPDGIDTHSAPFFTVADEEDATFRFEGIPVGLVEVEVETRRLPADRIEERSVQVRAGETTEVEFVYDGPNPVTSLKLLFSSDHAAWDESPTPESVALFGPDGARVPAERMVAKFRSRTAIELATGPHRLTIDDPRFEPVERFDLVAGSIESIELEGSSRITLAAVDAVTGEAIGDLKIDVRRPSGAEESWDWQRLRPVDHDEEGRPIYRTVPDPQRWTVEAPHYEEVELEFPTGFAPRAAQRVDIALERGLSIAGRVVDADGRPVEDARMRAHRVPDGDWSAWTDSDWHDHRGAVFSPPSSRSDANGDFEIGPLEPGVYDLFGSAPGTSPTTVFGLEAGTTDVLVELAPPGSIVGRFEPTFHAVERARVTVRRLFDDEGLQVRYDQGAPRQRGVRPDSDGVFRFDGLAPGRYEVLGEAPTIVVEGFSSGSESAARGGRPDPVLVDVASGQASNAVIGPGEWTPGVAIVEVHVNGEPMSGLHVSGYLIGVSELEINGTVSWMRAAIGATDGAGVAEVLPIQKGTWWFDVQPLDQSWSVRIPGEHGVEPGAELELSVDATIATAQLVFVDPDGTPLSNHRIEVETARRSWNYETDAQGAIELTRPPGTYEIHGATPRDGVTREPTHGGAFVEWTANGPTEERVVLAPLD